MGRKVKAKEGTKGGELWRGGGRIARARWKGNVCGAAGGRPSYIANPRQPHSITMLSRIQMTVISFGTPYT